MNRPFTGRRWLHNNMVKAASERQHANRTDVAWSCLRDGFVFEEFEDEGYCLDAPNVLPRGSVRLLTTSRGSAILILGSRLRP